MRFLVEVNALGQTEAKRYGIEADTWQRALQDTRKLRGEEGPISGFSIELLEDGCRAIDPMARLRYLVKKADASVGLGPLEDGRASSTVRPAGGISPSRAPRPVAAPTPKAPAVSPGPPSAPVSRPAPSVRPPAPAPAVAHAPPPPSAAPRIPPAPETQPLLPSEAPRRSATVLSKVEQAPTPLKPLYYREEAILVAPTAGESEIETALRRHLTAIQGEIASKPRGKFVQIAAFDAAPTNGKVKPLIVLAWKDWKGPEPIFSYPRRQSVHPIAAAASMPPSPSVSPSVRPPGPAPAHAPAAVASAPPPPPPPPTPAPAAAPVAAAPLAQAPAAPPAAISAVPLRGFTPPHGTVVPNRPTAQSSGGFPAAGARRSSPGGDRRVPGEELVAQLFEEMHALHFLNDALEGGHFCLSLAMDKLPSAAAYVHLYDIDRREFVIVCTRGLNTEVLLLERTGESDSLLASAMRKRRAVVVNDPSEEPAMNATRFSHLSGAKRIIVAPVMQAGRFLGAIELVNPLDGQPYSDLEGNALTYMGEQYAEFVAARGVVLEAEKVSKASQAARA